VGFPIETSNKESSQVNQPARPYVRQFENPRRPRKIQDPQIILEGELHQGTKAEVIIFKLRLLRLIELTFVVTVPVEGETRAPVYCRFKMLLDQADPPGSVVVGAGAPVEPLVASR
jgi:hypothetical protein